MAPAGTLSSAGRRLDRSSPALSGQDRKATLTTAPEFGTGELEPMLT